jgi:glucose/arabinose dehydrogenase
MARLTHLGLSAFVLCVLAPASARAAVALRTGAPADSFNGTPVDVDGGLSQPTDVAELPDGRLVIIERTGDVKVVSADGATTTEAGTITVNPDFGEQGLLGVVADPAFASNNTLYFYASVGDDPANKHKVYRITLGANNMLDAARNTVISMGLRASRSNVDGGASNHNGGGLFIHNNFLYVGVGDTGHNATPPTNRLGTCLNSTNGKILRVALNGDTPMDNPLVGETMVTGCTDWDQNLTMQAPDTRIFAWGFRNPYRFWIDPMTERLWVGDVGETTREEISVGAPITAAGGDGQHFGWPFREGTTNYSQSWQPQGACMGTTPARECVPAAFDYARAQRGAVIGGLIPSGCGWGAPWTSKYVFGDYSQNLVWTLDVNQDRSGVMANSLAEFATVSGIGSFRMGVSALYFVETGAGTITKITPKGQMPGMCNGMGGMGGMGGMSGAGGMNGGAGASAGTGMGGTSDGGTGMATAGGGAGGSASGSGGAGGSSGSTGGVPMGGVGATGGTTGGTTGGSAGAATGGSAGAATGGTGVGGAGTAGTGNAGAGGANDTGGCGCRVAGSGGSFGAVLAGLGAFALLGLRRARQRRGKLGRRS